METNSNHRTIIKKNSYGINLRGIYRSEITTDIRFKIYDVLQEQGKIKNPNDIEVLKPILEDLNENLLIYFKTPRVSGSIIFSDVEIHYGGHNEIILKALQLYQN